MDDVQETTRQLGLGSRFHRESIQCSETSQLVAVGSHCLSLKGLGFPGNPFLAFEALSFVPSGLAYCSSPLSTYPSSSTAGYTFIE